MHCVNVLEDKDSQEEEDAESFEAELEEGTLHLLALHLAKPLEGVLAELVLSVFPPIH